MAETINLPTSSQAKRIVYLIGAGASHAEATHKRTDTNLLMKDSEIYGDGISTKVLQKAKKYKALNIPLSEQIDIEKLISLFANAGTNKHAGVASELRSLYFHTILSALRRAGVLTTPVLAIGLLELHNNKLFNSIETLSGIISLNHDNLFQVASQRVFGCVNLGFNFKSREFKCARKEPGMPPPIVQMYGAFNWTNSLPIKVAKTIKRASQTNDTLWIPPSILKEMKNYPYNKLMGIAYDLLLDKCDVLRIIGCSLSQNDWNVISLIFNAQYWQSLFAKRCFTIELIMDPWSCSNIKKQCSYLQYMFKTSELEYGIYSDYDDYEEDPHQFPENTELSNAFKYWLVKKVNRHQTMGEIDANIGRTLRALL